MYLQHKADSTQDRNISRDVFDTIVNITTSEFYVKAVIRQKQKSGLRTCRFSPRVSIYLFSFCYEMMSICSRNYWIDWNSAAPCLKWLFNVEVLMFAWFVRPLLATILCVWEIWSGSNMQHVFYWLAKNKFPKKDTSPHRFWSRLMTFLALFRCFVRLPAVFSGFNDVVIT